MRESMEIYPRTAAERAMKLQSRTIHGIRTLPPPLRLLTHESGHFICYQKRIFLLANDTAG